MQEDEEVVDGCIEEEMVFEGEAPVVTPPANHLILFFLKHEIHIASYVQKAESLSTRCVGEGFFGGW